MRPRHRPLAVTLTAALCLAATAAAERGRMALSLQGGQLVAVAPTPLSSRTVPVLGTLSYGLSERWAMAGSVELELGPARGPTAGLAVGPKLTLYRDFWLTLELFGTAGAGWATATSRPHLDLEAGASLRYLLLWGLGVQLELGARGRAAAIGPFAPSGLLVARAGLYIDA